MDSSSNNIESPADPVIQYILIRTDLKWTKGAMIAQACHASVASIVKNLDLKSTKDYLDDLENMHKVVLGADSVDDIIKVESKLKEANIPHHVWLEKPENVVSCLAVTPQPKSLVQTIFRHFKLLR